MMITSTKYTPSKEEAAYLTRLTAGWPAQDQAYIKRAFGLVHAVKSVEAPTRKLLLKVAFVLAGEAVSRKEVVAALLLSKAAATPSWFDQVQQSFGMAMTALIGRAQATEVAFVAKAEGKDVDLPCMALLLAKRLVVLKGAGLVGPQKKDLATQTQAHHIPLARRLGCHHLQGALEEEVLKTLDPFGYHAIAAQVESKIRKARKDFNSVVREIGARLKTNAIKFRLASREKSIFSIYHKMRQRKVPFEEIYDRFGTRIILEGALEDEVQACRKVGHVLVHDLTCHKGRTRDWLTTPRPSGYQALHLTLRTPHGGWVEVQIRTVRMHQIATKGTAAHWKYKTLPQS